MKKIDCYKLSIHNIVNNKSRSILTTIIVYIMSLLIISLLSFGIVFSNNIYNIINKYYKEAEETIIINYYNYEYDGFNLSKYNEVLNCLKENKKVFSTAKFELRYQSGSSTYVDYEYFIPDNIEIIEGRSIVSSDSNTNKILISKEYKEEAMLNVGDTITQSYYFDDGEFVDAYFEIVGIYDYIDEDKADDYDSIYRSYYNTIVDSRYMLNNFPKERVSYAYFYYFTSDPSFNAKTLKKDLDKLCDDLQSILPKEEYEGKEYDTVRCYALDDLTMAFIVRIAIIGVVSFICLILVLLSIGSLANTIMISVDKNKKFIGLLKALGLNEKDLRSVIKMESVTTIALGVILSFFSLSLFKDIFANLNYKLIKSSFGSYLSKIDYKITYSIPIYVPFIVMIFFILLTFLFSRGSMSKITKTDPMAVISEVA